MDSSVIKIDQVSQFEFQKALQARYNGSVNAEWKYGICASAKLPSELSYNRYLNSCFIETFYREVEIERSILC